MTSSSRLDDPSPRRLIKTALQEDANHARVATTSLDPPPTSWQPTASDDPEMLALMRELSRGPVATCLPGGAHVGRLMILRALGAGGMGVVYAAYDPTLDRTVALKVLHPDHVGSEASRLRLYREAQALAKLTHPNIVQVYDVGSHDGRVWLSMEFVEGETLRAWRARVHPGWRETLAVLLQAARGVAAAHEAELLHRDLKPDNIMVGADGRVRVMDFGLARADSHGQERALASQPTPPALLTELTRAGAVMGTPAYMAPEQFRGDDANGRTDQFALCVTLWEALYGTRPFAAKTYSELATAVTSGHRAPTRSGAGVPRWLRRAIERGLALAPEDRYPDIPTLIEALENDPSSRRRALAIGLAALVPTLAWQFDTELEKRRALADCEAAGARIDGVWNDATREKLRDALLGTDAAFAKFSLDRVEPALDEYVDHWKTTRVDACEITTVDKLWNADLGDAAEACLDEAHEHLASRLELITTATSRDRDLIVGAVLMVAQLPALDHCEDEDLLRRRLHLPGVAPETRQELRRLRRLLARSSAFAVAGRLQEALRLATLVQAGADALGWGPLRARTMLLRGRILRDLNDYTGAEEAMLSAFRTAGATGDNLLLAKVADNLGWVVGALQTRGGEGAVWSNTSLTLLDGAGIDDDDVLRVDALNSLANIRENEGEFQEARALYERMIKIHKTSYGDGHPLLWIGRHNLADLLVLMGELEESTALYERNLALLETTMGPAHPDLTYTLLGLGNNALASDEPVKALEHYHRALEICEAGLEPNATRTADVLQLLGVTYALSGAADEAGRAIDRALGIYEATPGGGPPNMVAQALYYRGLAYLEQEQPERAQAPLERAIELAREVPGFEESRASAQFALAQALWPTPDQRARARDLATQARPVLAARAETAEQVADIDAWLSTHPLDDMPAQSDPALNQQ